MSQDDKLGEALALARDEVEMAERAGGIDDCVSVRLARALLALSAERSQVAFRTADLQRKEPKIVYDGREVETPSAIRPSLPPMNGDLGDILGRPNFTCVTIANLLRFDGKSIPKKAEDEQAWCIYFLLDLYLKHGDAWRAKAKEILGAIHERQKTAGATEGAAK